MVRTRRMENGDRHTLNKRCSSRNLGQRAVRNYAGNDEDDIDDVDDASDRIKNVVRRRKLKVDSSRDEESPKSEENCHDTRSRINKDEVDSNGEAVEEDEVKNSADSVKENGSGIRRSTRKKKFTYDTLNQKWLLEGRVPEFAYLDREERRLRRAKKIMDVNDDDDDVEVEDEPGDFPDDMYTRIKRDRRKAAQRFYRSRESKKAKRKAKRGDFDSDEDTVDENDTEEEEEESIEESTSIEDEEERRIPDGVVMPRTYYLRQKKPVTDRFQVQNEPTKLRTTCKSILHLSPPRRHIRQGNNFVTSFISPAHRSPLFKRRRTTHNSSSSSSSSGSDDERRFERHKAKSMAKARNRVLPMNLTGKEVDANLILRNRIKVGSSLADVDPMNVDKSVTFESVGGLVKHIQGLKEMLLLPLMYPEVFEKFKITPPRGVLFYGPPGTGKTLVARALANECSQSEKKVAFFMRKGADCLSKWVGESERQLRLLFDQAYSMRPSIIFFDEIDGLAPVRSTRQDQIHSSIVSTLLALMDGLDSRGEVVVIGATNRIDAIDSALRRPGRFDREFNFSLPACDSRKSILSIHTKYWDPPLETTFVEELAKRTTGYCGADLKALCAEAAFLALRRQFPEIYTSKQKLQLDVSDVKIADEDFQKAVLNIVPAAQRSIATSARPLSSVVKPLVQNSLNYVKEALRQIFPHGFINRDCDKTEVDEVEYLCAGDWQLSHRPRLLLMGRPGQAQSTHLGPAVLHFLERFPVHKVDLPSLYAVTAKSPEESCAQIFMEAQRQLPSILYLPHCGQWWETLSETVKVTFLNLIQDVEPCAPLLLLATSDCHYDKLPDELAACFDKYNGEVIEMKNPSEVDRHEYFSPLILKATMTMPQRKRNRKRRRAPLSAALSSPPRAFTQSELKKLEEDEEATMRELRLFLREILYKLARDRRFSIFAKPVDTSEVSDYLQVIKNPMDLETMMTKIDLHKYQTVGEFLDDINLVAYNALEYNPDRFPSDKIIRHRACALKDFAHALVSAELDLEFEKSCEEVREARKFRGVSPSMFAPKNCHIVRYPLKLEENGQQEGKPVEAKVTESSNCMLEQLPVPKKSALVEGTKDVKYRNRILTSRRKKSPWIVVRRRRRIVRPMKLVVYSEDSLDVMPGRESQANEGQSLVNGDHRLTEPKLNLSPVAEGDGMTFFPKEKGSSEMMTSSIEVDEVREVNSNKQPPVELVSNESVMSVDSLSSNNLSSLSNTEDIGVVSSVSVKKEDALEVQQEEVVKQSDPECKSLPSIQIESNQSLPALEVDVNLAEEAYETENEIEEASPVFIVDEQRAEDLLKELVNRTKDLEVAALERIYCRLSRIVYKHRSDWDRSVMLDSLETEINLMDSLSLSKLTLNSRGSGCVGS